MNQEEQNQETQGKHYTPEEREEYIAELQKDIASKKPVEVKRKPVSKIIWYSALAIACLIVVSIAIDAIFSSDEVVDIPSSTTSALVDIETGALTINEQNYLNAVGDTAVTLSDALTKFGSLSGDFQAGNDEWTLQVAAQIVIIRGEYEKTANLVPPDSLSDVHNKLYLGMSCFNDMTYLFTEGVDNIDADLIYEAVSKLDEWTEYISEATDLIYDFIAAH